MADYLTGTTNTRTLSGTISLTDGGGSWKSEGSVGFAGYAVSWTTSWYSYGPYDPDVVPPFGEDPAGGRKVDLLVLASTPGNGFSVITTTLTDPTTLSGTYSITIPTREILKLGYISADSPWAAQAVEGQNGTATATITVLGVTRTRTQASTSRTVDAAWSMRSYTNVVAGGTVGSGTQTVTIGAAPTTGATGAVPASITKSGAPSGAGYSYTCAASSSESTVSASSTVSGGGGHPNATAEATVSLMPKRECTLNGAVYQMAEAYPGAIKYRTTQTGSWVDSTTGTFAASISQRNYDVLATVFEHTGTLGAGTVRNRITGERKNIKPWYQLVTPFVTYEAVLQLHGPQWDAIQLAKTDAVTIDDGTTLTPTGTWAGAWSASSGGSVAVSSGAIKATGSSGKKFSRTITGTGKMQGYSRIRVRLKCSAASHSINIGTDITTVSGSGVSTKGMNWAVTTGAANTATDLYLDLGAQTDGPEISVWDKNNTISSTIPGTVYIGAYYGNGGGVHFSGLGAGDYEVEEIELLMAPSSSSSVNIFPGSRKVVAIGDCMQTLDSATLTRPELTPSGTPITTVVTDLTSQSGKGWTVTDLTPPTTPTPSEPYAASEIQKSNHPALFLGGDGLLWDGTAWTPSMGGDGARGTFSTLLPAQWLVYEASWDWPETTMGGFLVDGALGAGIVHGRALWGRVLESSTSQTPGDASDPVGKDPASSATVYLLDTSGTVIDDTTTGSDGWYNFGKGAFSGAARLRVTGRDGFVEKALHDVHSRLVVVRQAPPDGTLLAMACSATGRVVRAYRDTDDTLLLEFWNRIGWDTKDTGLTVTGSGAMSYDRQSLEGRLWLAIEDGSAIKGRYTDDEGDTWSVATTIFSSGEKPAITVSPTGARHYFCVSGSAIKTKVLDSQGNTMIAESTVVSSSVASSAIDAVHDGTLILLTYRNTSNAVVTVISSDGGVTFT